MSSSDEKSVRPYYMGYEDRYALTYRQGGDTWETQSPNDIVTQLVPSIAERFDSVKILDLGCGEGRDSIWLASEGYDVTGVDISPSALNRAQELAIQKGVDPKFQEDDVVYLKAIPNDHYNIAINMGCLHMLDDPHHRASHLKQVYKKLARNGFFMVNHCTKNWLEGFWSVENFDEVKDCQVGDVIPRKIRISDGKSKIINMPILNHKVSSEDELVEELKSAGFTDFEIFNECKFAFGNSAIILCRK
ncbi:MAG: class I SAM-dependent methyltransferase [Gammaproteobacteria bacterium]|nr:class I SAM-dependent methyltransferase [Gammaproteobacteria bacterium]MDD9883011.1 class I SAM-dependent methyltransferase [Gammaproteobacteria bacterium]